MLGSSPTGSSPLGSSPKKGGDDAPPDPRDREAFQKWLEGKPREWSMVIAARVALRLLPLALLRRVDTRNAADIMLPVFRAAAIARFAALYPKRSVGTAAAAAAAAARNAGDAFTYTAAATTADVADSATYAAVGVRAAAELNAADPAAFAATAASDAAYSAAADASFADADAASAVIQQDALMLMDGMPPDRLARAPLWQPTKTAVALAQGRALALWSGMQRDLSRSRERWRAWVTWYNHVPAGSPPSPTRSEAWEAAFTDVEHPSYPWKGPLPWDDGPEAVNLAIKARLDKLSPSLDGVDHVIHARLDDQSSDPLPIEGVASPISFVQRPDGRIAAEPGVFALPELPPSLSPEDLARTLAACRSRAEGLRSTAAAPTFQGRPDYAEALSAYLEWLPAAPGTGNMLLADGEARVLNKLFTADDGILATGFASRLSVFLEDHIGLRAFYEEIERHYKAVRTGRLATPLARDAVEGVQQVVHNNTPAVFDESVPPVVDETAKPVPEPAPLAPEDRPPPDPSRPKPPRDPIADVDPKKSRSYIFATAANRIWEILLKGKDVPNAVEGWRKTYEQMKPHIGPILDWLRAFNGG